MGRRNSHYIIKNACATPSALLHTRGWAGDRTKVFGPHVRTINGAPQCGKQGSKGVLDKDDFLHRKSHSELSRMFRMFIMSLALAKSALQLLPRELLTNVATLGPFLTSFQCLHEDIELKLFTL